MNDLKTKVVDESQTRPKPASRFPAISELKGPR
jgi:hypothetical protein